MDICSDRRCAFDLPPEDLWPRMVQVGEYRRWWPWLRACDATGFEVGDRWTCVVQPPLPYSLRFVIMLEEIEPNRFATAAIAGDITGTARIDVTATPGGSELRLVSRLSPVNPLLRAVAAVARPVAQRGHDWVMDTGLRQFRAKALPSP